MAILWIFNDLRAAIILCDSSSNHEAVTRCQWFRIVEKLVYVSQLNFVVLIVEESIDFESSVSQKEEHSH